MGKNFTLEPFPALKQVLPGPLAPEGVLAIPSRDLLVVSGESDDPSFGVRSSIMIYELQSADAQYPQLVSGMGEDGRPIGWSALVASMCELNLVWLRTSRFVVCLSFTMAQAVPLTKEDALLACNKRQKWIDLF